MGFMPDYVNNEVPLCKAKDMNAKRLVESVLLKYRISYFVETKNKFFMDKSERFVFKINKEFLEQAKKALEEVDSKDIIPVYEKQ